MEIKFNNRPNPGHTIDGKIVWESRSVAVVGVVFGKYKGEDLHKGIPVELKEGEKLIISVR